MEEKRTMQKKEKEQFLGDIRKHLSQQHARISFKRTKLGLKLSPVTAIILGALLVTGALLGFIWSFYTITITGDIEVNGGQGEAVMLYYDDVLLTGSSMNITTMDIETISAGETLRYPHHVDNMNGHGYNFTLDLSGMPCRETDEESLWYGFTIYAYEHNTTTELTEFTVPPEESYTFDLEYSVHPLFQDPAVPFPFLMTIDIELYDTTPVGIADFYIVENTAPYTVIAPGILGNDQVPGPGELTAALIDDVTNGTLDLNENGSFTYTAYPGYTGIVTFTYRPMLGEVEGYPATVTIEVLAGNSPPIANPDGPVRIYRDTTTVQDVLANDVDTDGPENLTIIGVINPAPDRLNVNIENNKIQIYPHSNDSPATFVIQYTISDGEDTATSTLTVYFQ